MGESLNRSTRRHEPGPPVLAGHRAPDRELSGPVAAAHRGDGEGEFAPYGDSEVGCSAAVPTDAPPAVEAPVRPLDAGATHIESKTDGDAARMSLAVREQSLAVRVFFTTTTAMHARGPWTVTW
ncbi:hypothetical protein ACIOHC_32660 [Streptomyces sp. NPDC088252]|uniref:hypothetical protein n=1 Tax=Streptomyces sp. NPDC088252 TaxID=3365845 RepID=UPI0037FF4399